MEPFSIVQVPDDAAWNIENLGTKPKFWYRDEAGNRILYKEARPNTGEDWSEVIAAQISKLIGIPCAEYSFATW